MKKRLDLQAESGFLEGNAYLYCFRQDLIMKYSDVVAHQTVKLENAPYQKGLRLVITLEGETEIHFNHSVFKIEASKQVKAAFLLLNQTEMGSKIFKANQVQRELVIFLYPEWLTENHFQLLDRIGFLQNHLKSHEIVVTQSMQQLITQLLEEDEPMEIHHLLLKESLVLALLGEAFSQLISSPLTMNKRIQELTHYLNNGEFDRLSLIEMAKFFHTNITTLQKEFYQCHHKTIGAYQRISKLERAYKALLQGKSVSQAAELAGYGNPDNFSTAFRKIFGINPRKIKQINKNVLVNG